MRIPTGRHSDFDLSIQSFDLFLLKLTVSLQVLHLKAEGLGAEGLQLLHKEMKNN